MRGVLLFFSILHSVLSSCPDGFDLVRDGQCRGLAATMANVDYNLSLNTSIAKCNEIQAIPVKILNDEEQEYWRAFRTFPGNFLPIGLDCNATSKHWQWSDGSAMTYKPATYHADLDKDCVTGCSWNLWDTGYWNNACGNSKQTLDIYCIKQLHQLDNAADGCDGFEDDSEDGECYQIGEIVENWQDAQKTCKNVGADLASIHSQKENSFIRRMAISRGAINGLFLGGTSTGKSNDFGWIDGSDWDYANFYSGFPVAGLGDCLAMDTAGSTGGEWVNTDCSNSMSVACVRKPRNHECTNGPWKEGEMITSPGFPFEASIPCDYMLSVPAGKRVEVEIEFLEANTCCDHAVLYENYIGGTVLANVTGELSDKVYKTKSSNFMRVSWYPQGGVNVRGLMFTFRAV